MDDYSINSLIESKNEWCSKLVTILTPAIIDGIKSIFKEASKLCGENGEEEKYLMTFQTFLSRIPQWNANMIETEKQRIEESSGCHYLDELIACVHIVQLKALTCVRVGQKQKKIDINIPQINDFIHKTYHNVARKLYQNIYLFERDIQPLQTQKYNNKLELIVKECILETVRENMPIETILKAYIDESYEEHIEVKEEIIPCYDEIETVKSLTPVEQDVEEKELDEDKEEDEDDKRDDEIKKELENVIASNSENLDVVIDTEPSDNGIQFSDIDNKISTDGIEEDVFVSKDINELESKLDENDNNAFSSDDESMDDVEDGGNEVLKIGDDVTLDTIDINDLNRDAKINDLPVLNDIEVLE